jgi:hypothetical protein
MFTTPTQVIEKLGGPAEVASLLKRPYSTVFSWQHRKVIPPSAWADLVEVAREKRVKGLTFEALAALPKQPAKRRKAA